MNFTWWELIYWANVATSEDKGLQFDEGSSGGYLLYNRQVPSEEEIC